MSNLEHQVGPKKRGKKNYKGLDIMRENIRLDGQIQGT